jgi:hypothetical protein
MDNDTLPKYDSASLYPHTKRISSSQFISYLRNPQEFYLNHTMGITTRPTSNKMIIGSIFSALYQNRNFNYKKCLTEIKEQKYIPLFERNIKKFPVIKGGHPEFPFIVKVGDWEIRITLDDFVKDDFIIIENKTGQTEWTQERVDTDPQLSLQAWGCWKTLGVPPKKIFLNWLDMRPKTRQELRTFKTSRSMKTLKFYQTLVEMVIKNIEAGNFTKSIYE